MVWWRTLNKIKYNQFGWTVEYADNTKIKRNKERRALFGNQRVKLLINSVGKRTVVLLNPSFLLL